MWGAIIGLAGTALGLYSSKKQSDAIEDNAKAEAVATEEAAKHNAELSLHDAAVMERAAREDEYATGVALMKATRDMTLYLGNLRTSAAKSGVAVGTGTPLDIEVYSKKNLVRDIQMIKYNGRKASAVKRELAERYRMLAKFGLRDAAAAASAVMTTANDQAKASMIAGVGTAVSSLYQVGTRLDWF
jgi:hypothetical protein